MTTTSASLQLESDSPPPVICPYCGQRALLTTGDVIYEHRPELHSKAFWLCSDCDAYVGCHRGTTRPLGRLADSKLRWAKIRAHNTFDPLWQSYGMSRTDAYAWLARKLKITADQCHVGLFDIGMCNRVVDLCEEFIRERRPTNLQAD